MASDFGLILANVVASGRALIWVPKPAQIASAFLVQAWSGSLLGFEVSAKA